MQKASLLQVEKECESLNIQFHLLLGEAKTVIPKFAEEAKIGCLVTDMSPLRVPMGWVNDLKKILPDQMCFYQVRRVITFSSKVLILNHNVNIMCRTANAKSNNRIISLIG